MKQETIEGAAIAYSEYRFITPDCISERAEERCLACKEGFIVGVSWYKSRVWHKNTEMPSDGVNKDGIGKPCIVQEGSRVFLCHVCCTTIGKYYFTDHLHTWHPVENVDCWAYLSDLIPTSFDEILEGNKDVLQRLRDNQNG